MPYDAETRRAALACLAAQEGNYRKASAATGISVSTLRPLDTARRARKEERRGGAARRDSDPRPAPPGDAQQQLERLVLVNMLEDARQLAGSLQEVIDDAPLGQRATALNQLLDKILRIMALLPRQEEVLVRVEFQGEDGAAHEAPPWAGADSWPVGRASAWWPAAGASARRSWASWRSSVASCRARDAGGWRRPCKWPTRSGAT